MEEQGKNGSSLNEVTPIFLSQSSPVLRILEILGLRCIFKELTLLGWSTKVSI